MTSSRRGLHSDTPARARRRHRPRGCSCTSGAEPRLHAMLTVASALLVAWLGRALVHASGVLCPGGDAWLLVGVPGSGAATAARLVAAGWGRPHLRPAVRSAGFLQPNPSPGPGPQPPIAASTAAAARAASRRAPSSSVAASATSGAPADPSGIATTLMRTL